LLPLEQKQTSAKKEARAEGPQILGVITWEAHRKEVEAGWRAARVPKRPTRALASATPAGLGE